MKALDPILFAAHGDLGGFYAHAHARYELSTLIEQKHVPDAKTRAHALCLCINSLEERLAHLLYSHECELALIVRQEIGKLLPQLREALDESKKE